MTDVGHKYLGSYIGTDEGITFFFIEDQIDEWVSNIKEVELCVQNDPWHFWPAKTTEVQNQKNVPGRMFNLNYYILLT